MYTVQIFITFLLPSALLAFSLQRHCRPAVRCSLLSESDNENILEKENSARKNVFFTENLGVSLLTSSLMFLGSAEQVFAKDGEFGILEGRTIAMIHPISMLVLFLASIYTGYVGLQWKQLREIGNEIRELSTQLPSISSGKVKLPISESLASVESMMALVGPAESEDNQSKLAVLKKDMEVLSSGAVRELDSRIQALTASRKSLQAKDLRETHWNAGSVLLGSGVCLSILGGLDTYFRAGKLFPGPHLFAGLGITALWAAAAALVPAMQKGNDAARTGHIVLNSVNIGLFAWQVYTGLDIMIKVWGFTKWP